LKSSDYLCVYILTEINKQALSNIFIIVPI